MTCINCGAEDEGRFCSHCAQPLKVKRITFKEGWHDFWARIYGFDGMFPRTFKDLTIRPGFASREFIRGNRARYYGPVGYYFLMITLFLLLLSMIGMNFVEYMETMQKWVADNLKLIAFFIVPFLAITSRYIFFRKQGLNFMEHTVPVFYMLGHWYWFQMLEATVLHYTGFHIGAMWQMLLVALYCGVGYISFVPDQPKWKVFLKGVGTYLTGYMLMFIATAIIATIGIVILVLIDPSYLDSLRPPKNP